MPGSILYILGFFTMLASSLTIWKRKVILELSHFNLRLGIHKEYKNVTKTRSSPPHQNKKFDEVFVFHKKKSAKQTFDN